ncbi:MAG: DUF86 domain-containing protein [Cyanobacteria bacterium J06581_3]
MVQRDIRDYLNDILTHIALAEKFVKGMSFEEFQTDDKTILALTRAIEIVGEATKQIPDDLRLLYPDIVWQQIVGMRNRLAHAYFGIDLEIVWNTTHKELPELRPAIQTLLDKLTAAENELES